MKFSEDFIREHGLTEEQVKAVSTQAVSFIADREAEIKKEFEGSANTNAERIIQGAADKVADTTGIKRDTGEKLADFLQRASTLHLDTSLAKEREALLGKQREIEELKKSGKFDVALQTELDDTKLKLAEAQKKEAEISEAMKSMVSKDEYDNTLKSLGTLKHTQAYNSVKPRFAEGVNEYEAAAKWKEFMNATDEKYIIELDNDLEAVYKERANEYKTGKLKDLVKTDETLKALVAGRQTTGLGAKEQTQKLENVPFPVPINASSSERTKLITDYLTGELKLSKTSTEYAKKFAEINTAIVKSKKA